MKSFLESLMHALRGAGLAMREEKHIRIHVLLLIAYLLVAAILSYSIVDYAIIFAMAAVVLTAEGINSAIERLCDVYTTERQEPVRDVKDIAAGAVLMASVLAAVVGALLFVKNWPF